jgi:glutamate dehydrogenase
VAAEVPAGLAAKLAGLDYLVSALDIVEVTRALKQPAIEGVAKVYFYLGDWLALDWLRDRIVALPRNDRWQALARAALRDDLYREHAALTADVLRMGDPDRDCQTAVEAWVDGNRAAVGRCSAILAEIKGGSNLDLAILSVALREIRSLIQDRRLAG